MARKASERPELVPGASAATASPQGQLLADSLPSVEDILAGLHDPIPDLEAATASARALPPSSSLAERRGDGHAPGAHGAAASARPPIALASAARQAGAPKPLTFAVIRDALGGAEADELLSARTLRLDWRGLTTLDALDALPQIRNLYAQHNAITALPESLGGLAELRVLVLADNRITSLRGALSGLRRLHTLDAARNAIGRLSPEDDLPASLAHLVLAGNPWCLAEPRYRSRLTGALPSLVSLDGFDLETGEEVLPSAAAGAAAAELLAAAGALDADARSDSEKEGEEGGEKDGEAEGEGEEERASRGAGGEGGRAGHAAAAAARDAAQPSSLAAEAEEYFRKLRRRAQEGAGLAEPEAAAAAASGAGAPTPRETGFESMSLDAVRRELQRLREARTVLLGAEVAKARTQADEASRALEGRVAAAAAEAAAALSHTAQGAVERSRARMKAAQEAHQRRMEALREGRLPPRDEEADL
ncbi:hypothetical protein FNF27_07346 [Cafeteria roenbergensis]|uniref:U2A'/phosphoprotein 32 family A C-terminal domain-containing protein n=2 Tax=Cafeteria roenbergensis TaxID=33653 RepID=A0A5A8DPB4_CAFRO|nr:hypothetical protein FNF27_07346 [Cafeteria roenbergensis]